MPTVKVYKFEIRDGPSGRNVSAPRMATRERIRRAKGTAIDATEREIDSSLVDAKGYALMDIQPDE